MPPETLPPAWPQAGFPRAELATEILAAAAEREAADGFPAARLARIRAAAGRLAAGEFRPDDLRHGALLLERQAELDLQVPTASRVPGVSVVKQVLKKLMIWYLRFLGHQISAFGTATARFGVTVANRMDSLDGEVAELRRRVERLEAGDPGGANWATGDRAAGAAPAPRPVPERGA